MDHIRKAILKAKAAQKHRAEVVSVASPRRPPDVEPKPASSAGASSDHARPLLDLDPKYLEANRIVAHLPHSPLTVGFDILRTQVYQVMRERGWRTLLVTSPTPGCGKTVTAINLAISLARQHSCFAVLIDCDFRKPNVAEYLGYSPDIDLIDVLDGHCTVAQCLQGFTVTGGGLGVIATRDPLPRPSEVLSSQSMKDVVASIKAISPDTLAIFDVPPMLVADDVMAFLPEIDGVVLLVTPGKSTYADVDACLRNIPKEKLIGTVLTKYEGAIEQHHYTRYYGR
jgi:Mrp family chromosome partitioning ATPase